MAKFSKFIFKEKALKEINLPLIDYPIPFDKVKTMYSYTSTISPTILIYWIMEYMNNNFDDREYYEKALFEICENHAPISGRTEFWFNAKSKYAPNPDNIWCLKLGKVDLSDSIVTYENNHKILLAVARCKEDKTKIETSFFTVPNQEIIASLRCHSIDPHVKMLRNPSDANSFARFQHLTWKMDNIVSEGEVKEIKVNWEYGIGYNFNKQFNNKYRYALNLNPIPNDWIAFLFNIILECENKEIEKIVEKQRY